jgi:propanol-preferring alcohol dehydrogenase
MKSMQIQSIEDLSVNREPLVPAEAEIPEPRNNEILVRVSVCGVCHTELDEIEGRTPPANFPMIPGHQVVGRVQAQGKGVSGWNTGDRAGIGWIFSACGECPYCKSGFENLCPDFHATGRDAHGGYAEYMTVPAAFAYRIPQAYDSAQAAPLLCAGAIGYRSLRLTGIRDGDFLGLTGFGASAHLVLKLARYLYPATNIFVFARSEKERSFAKELGAVWAGDSNDLAPQRLHAIIDTTPVWKPVLGALENLAPNGRLVINAIRKEDVDRFDLANLDYPRHLWMEKEIKSVANVARRDVQEFLDLAAGAGIFPEYQEYPLTDANRALLELKERRIRGAKVLRIHDD